MYQRCPERTLTKPPNTLVTQSYLVLHLQAEMEPTQITHDFPQLFRVHNTGRIERYQVHDFVPPSHDTQTGVTSRDVLISPETNVSVRIYLCKTTESDRKLPLIVYIHGGAFCIQSAFSSFFHNYVNSLASASRSVVVSIEYRLAPEHPVPACYHDCYDVLKWIDSHSRAGGGPDPWLNEYADFERVFIAGECSGANIVHNLAIRANTEAESGLNYKLAGLILFHPFFGDGEADKLWDVVCTDSAGGNDVRLNPVADMDLLSKLGSDRVVVCLAEKDRFRGRGLGYYEALKKSGWKGVVELFETPGERHVFHLHDPSGQNAFALQKRIADFINSTLNV